MDLLAISVLSAVAAYAGARRGAEQASRAKEIEMQKNKQQHHPANLEKMQEVLALQDWVARSRALLVRGAGEVRGAQAAAKSS